MSQSLFCDMRNEGFCVAICGEGCGFWMPKRMCAVSVFVVLRMPSGILVVVPRRQR